MRIPRTATKRNTSSSRYAICIDNSEYPASLEILKLYRVLRDRGAEQDGDVRVIDESGEDYLYPASYFVRVELPRHTLNVLKKSTARLAANAR
jgi:hypothetical protein